MLMLSIVVFNEYVNYHCDSAITPPLQTIITSAEKRYGWGRINTRNIERIKRELHALLIAERARGYWYALPE